MKPTNQDHAVANVKSALIAGITAFVIYFVIAVLMTRVSGGVLLISFAVGVATCVVAWIVTTIMARRRKG